MNDCMNMENPAPLVSIVMPAYNVERYIGAAIQSVMDQTYPHWELLIVNDGSTDDTANIVEPFLQDPRVQSVRQAVSRGASAARNAALEYAKGNFIAFLDADDIWLPEKLVKQLDIFQKYPDVGVCGTGMKTIDADGKIIGSQNRKAFHGHALPDLLTNLSVGMSTAMVRKDVYDKIGGFDTRLPCAMDYDFWLRAALSCKFYIISGPLSLYRIAPESISSRSGEKRRDLVMYTIIPRFLNEYGGSKYVKWYHVWQLHGHCYYGRAMDKTKWFEKTYWLIRAISCNPLHWDSWTNLAQQFLPRSLYNTLKSLGKK